MPVPASHGAGSARVRSKNGSTTVMASCANIDLRQLNFPGCGQEFAECPTGLLPLPINARGSHLLSAPENQFAGLMHAWDSEHMVAAEPRGAMRGCSGTRSRLLGLWRDGCASEHPRGAAAAIAHSQAVQQQMHEDFMNTLQRGTDMSMQRTADSMNARSTSASDWVDYSLDRQTVMDTNTGASERYPIR